MSIGGRQEQLLQKGMHVKKDVIRNGHGNDHGCDTTVQLSLLVQLIYTGYETQVLIIRLSIVGMSSPDSMTRMMMITILIRGR